MTQVSVERLPLEQEPSRAARPARRALVLAAWAATLILSQLPLVIARDVLGGDIPWITPAWLMVAALLFAATFAWQALRPLRSYFLVMGLVILFAYGLLPLVGQSTAWRGWFGEAPIMISVLAFRVLAVLATLVVLAVTLRLGYSRQELFLQPGDMNAPALSIRVPGRRLTVGWGVYGTVMALALAGLVFYFLISSSPGLSLAAALPWLPLVLLNAVLNAFIEEGMYRAAPLAILHPLVGRSHAVWLTALWFGLGHYYGGIPSGPAGFVMSGLLGLLLGNAMLDTRGMGWPMIIHIALDAVIFTFLAAGM